VGLARRQSGCLGVTTSRAGGRHLTAVARAAGPAAGGNHRRRIPSSACS
jgi:hypothetical protein